MLLFLDSLGNIVNSTINFLEGLNYIGNIKGIVDYKYLKISKINEHDLLMLPDDKLVYLYGDAIIFKIKNSNLKYIFPDISGVRDIFYAKMHNKSYIISEDFFEIISQFTVLNIDKNALNFFIIHGYFPPGKTYFKEIIRIRAGNVLINNEGSIIERNIFEWSNIIAPSVSYKIFKLAFNSIFENEIISNDDALLLSGGCDSGLIAALSYIKCNKKPLLITMKYKQNMELNYNDVEKSVKIANFYGAPFKIIDVDFNKYTLKNLETFVYRMPLAAHLSMGFYEMIKNTSKLGINRVWCGQNADSVYNLGPTGKFQGRKGIGELIRRYFLSREYFTSLFDITERSWGFPVIRAMGYFASILMSTRKYCKIGQPKSFNQLKINFLYSDNYLALSNNYYINLPPLYEKISTQKARQMLFDEKLSSFITGCDSRVIYSAGKIFKTDILLPFTSTNMIHFFRNLEMAWKDIIYPKRYIYKYLKELMGSKNYKKIYSSHYKNDYNSIDNIVKWEENIIGNTIFGQQLLFETSKEESFVKYFVKNNNLHHLLSLFWYRKIKQRIKSMGIKINVKKI